MPVSDWIQQTLTPPEAVEVNIRLGIIPSTDHVQVMVEAKDPLTGILLAQASMPHTTLRQYEPAVEWAVHQARVMFDELADPF